MNLAQNGSISVISVLCVALFVSPAHAESVEASATPRNAYSHNGWFMRTAVGPGYFSDTVSLGEQEGRTGNVKITGLAISGELSVGGTLKSVPLVIAGNFTYDAVNRPSEVVHPVSLNSLGPLLVLYPWRTGGLNFSLGAGISMAEVVGDVRGYSARVGAGYEFWVSEELSIGGQARLLIGSYDNQKTSPMPALMLTVTEH